MLTLKDLQEFQKLWKEQYDEDLSDEDARKYAERLLRYVKLVVTPDQEDRH